MWRRHTDQIVESGLNVTDPPVVPCLIPEMPPITLVSSPELDVDQKANADTNVNVTPVKDNSVAQGQVRRYPERIRRAPQRLIEEN